MHPSDVGPNRPETPALTSPAGQPQPTPAPGYPAPGGGPPVVPGYPGPSPYGGYRVPEELGLPRPVAVAPIGDTPFGVALVEVRALPSGPAIGSLLAGIASILVSFVVGILVGAGAQGEWGPPVAGAFAVLASVFCAAAAGLAVAARRRIRADPPWGATQGQGMATAGLTCGLVGLALTALFMVIAVLG